MATTPTATTAAVAMRTLAKLFMSKTSAPATRTDAVGCFDLIPRRLQDVVGCAMGYAREPCRDRPVVIAMRGHAKALPAAARASASSAARRASVA